MLNACTLLIVLHGKRVEDDLVRDAICSLIAEGHQVCWRRLNLHCNAVCYNA
jgi:hypothetical protein